MKELYVGRQPILNRAQRTVAYEVLYRSGQDNCFDVNTCGTEASLKVISSIFTDIGIRELAFGKPVFINFNKDLLFSELPELSPDSVVVEILEDVEVDDSVYNACLALRKNGFRIALDDFILHEGSRRLLKLASIIKIDWRADPVEHIRAVCKELEPYKLKLLAEKVETEEEFRQALELGFDLFQGFFFERPVMVRAASVKVMSGTFMEIMGLLQADDMNLDEIEKVIARDAALSYKLLKIINSAATGLSRQIDSIRQALVLLGIDELKRWIMLLMLVQHGQKCPSELLAIAFIRAIFGEKLALCAGRDEDAPSVYMVGLLSVFDAMLKRPIEQVVSDLPLSPPLKDALVHEKGPLSPYFQMMHAYENADRKSISRLAQTLGIESSQVVRCYLDSLRESGLYIQAMA